MTTLPRTSNARAVLYTRISNDPTKQGLGVERQHEDGLDAAARYGWTVVDLYADNDKSATNGKPRPEFERMVSDFKAGRFDAVIVWNSDRLTREPVEGEMIIKLATENGLRLANVYGDIDLSTADGRTMFRIKVALSKAETERSSERIKRQRDQAAQQGRPHGMVAFGYRRVREFDDHGRQIGSRDVIDEAQADVVRETARRLLTGESMRSIVKSLNERGAPSPKGKRWESTTLRQVMLRDRNAGLRRHRGEVIGKAAWEPIYDEGTHDRVVALLRDPSRLVGESNKGATRKHLLSGIAVCGLCGGEMRVTSGTVYRGKPIPPKYQCRACLRVARKQTTVDEYVTAVAIKRLMQPESLAALASGKPERATELRDRIDEARARLELVADEFADGNITADQLKRVTAKLRPQIEGWKAELAACAPRNGLTELSGPDAAAKWDNAVLDVKRSAINALMRVTILPTGSGVVFDPAKHLRIEPTPIR